MILFSFQPARRIATRIMLAASVGLAVFALTLPLHAQEEVPTGNIAGSVSGPGGKAVAGIDVAATHSVTAQTTHATTSANGAYTLSALTPGDYVVRFSGRGFHNAELRVTVEAGATVGGSIALEPGIGGEPVAVNASQPTVETSTAGYQMRELPSSRNFLDLAQLAPGVQFEDGLNFDPAKAGFTSVSIAGRSGRNTYFEADGADISDEIHGATIQDIAVGSIRELQVGQSSMPLSEPLSGPGLVTVATRSGTDELHGEAFGAFRDTRAGGGSLPGTSDNYFHRDVFGANVGGPLISDRLFFFVAGEHFQQNLFESPFFNPAFFAAGPPYHSPFRDTELSGRLDYRFQSSAHLFYKFSYDDSSDVAASQGQGFQAFKNRAHSPVQTIGLDFRTGAYSHGLRFSYVRLADSVSDATGAGIYNPAPGISLYISGTPGFGTGPSPLEPQRSIQSSSQFRYDGSGRWGAHNIQYGASINRISGYEFANLFGSSPMVGSNAGAASLPLASSGPFPGGITNPLNYPVDSIMFGSGLGCLSSKSALDSSCGGFGDTRTQFYVGDNWKTWRNLTLNFGVAYVRDSGRPNSDLAPVPCSAATATAPPCTGSGNLLDQFGNFPGLGNRERRPNLNFAPQAGIAWDPTGGGKTSIRGGIGLYYDNTLLNSVILDRALRSATGAFAGQQSDVCPGGLAVLPNGTVITSVDGLNIANQICGQPVGSVSGAIRDLQAEFQAANAALTSSSPNPSFVGRTLNATGLIAPNFQTPRSVQMNIGLQHQLWQSTVFSVDYVRNVGTHSLIGYDTNHVGDASYLNTTAALNAINATVTPVGCAAATSTGASSQAAVACYESKVPGATIADFARAKTDSSGTLISGGLDSGGQELSGYPASYFGSTPAAGAAFPGINPAVGRNTMYFPIGRSVYSGLQFALRSQVNDPLRGIRGMDIAISYSRSKIVSNMPAGDSLLGPDLLPLAVNFNNPSQSLGQTPLDRKNQISFSTVLETRGGFHLAFVGHFDSPLSQTLYLPSTGAPGEIFRSDINGDGAFGGQGQTGNGAYGDVIPGTSVGGFGQTITSGNLNNAIRQYNLNDAGRLTPAGVALVSAGLFSAQQLQSLGAVTPALVAPANGNIGPSWLRVFDLTLSRAFKIGERIAIEPRASAYNLFNFSNFGTAGFNSGGIILPQLAQPGQTNSIVPQAVRAGLGSGVFATGAPRQLEFGLRITF
ncbi:MAG: carboxypeptidase regulatory-like domain-containing protein [Acidobacteriales bacterium]|nr:carboxypeptidase regulatory-like domain-containing protein [Terriglobales bacterium]